MSNRKSRIAARFGAAAIDYDAHSPLQREAAQRLAARVKGLSLPAAPRVLEIGCGTGHLTRELLPALGGDWVASDIAPAMVRACRRRVGGAAQYIVMDGERPALAPGRLDLIVASLAAQWFADLATTLATLAQLLAPGGRIALVTLGAGTFAEWRMAHAAAGFAAATPAYPEAAALARAFPADLEVEVAQERFVEPPGDPLEFVRGLRRIGADTPAPGTQPLSAGQMRRVLRALAAGGGGTTYHLLYAIALRSSSTSQPRVTR
ncbi:MAG: methyltransferase domain-containing protein [Rhodocyclaceae bacterium]|nr:methyltransferase domain-containing protein [Rhodocyclaceae bacterium]